MLLDTSGLLCYFNANDSLHRLAAQSFTDARWRVIHNYVLAEFVALSQARRLPREDSLAFAGALTDDPKVDLHWVDRPLHNEAMQLLETQLDKTYSLCDAVSFALMRRLGLLDALTTDHHFEQAGFRRLLV